MPDSLGHQSITVSFANGGFITKSSPDEIPIQAYKALWNVATTRENALTVRRGFDRLNDGLPVDPIGSYLLKDYLNTRWRYAVSNNQLYVAPVEDPGDTAIWTGTDFGAVLGGSGLSTAQDPRPIFATQTLRGTEVKPYMFIADGAVFLKHSGGSAYARRVGIPRPVAELVSAVLEPHADTEIDDCDDDSKWTGGSASATRATYQPTIWWEDTGATRDPRYLYAKYSWVLNDGGDDYESGLSDLEGPRYIPRDRSARIFCNRPEEVFPIYGTSVYGGSGGTIFEDIENVVPPTGRVRGIRIWSGQYIDSLQIIYELPDGSLLNGPRHGGTGGDLHYFQLDFDEYITRIEGRYGNYVDKLRFVTNKQTTEYWGGSGGSTNFSIDVPDGSSELDAMEFIGFSGRAGDQVDKLGLTYRQYRCNNPLDSPPGNAVGWNLYVGETAATLRKVNSTAIPVAEYFTEPNSGFEYTTSQAPFYNRGVLADDAAGQTGSAVNVSITGDGVSGRIDTYFSGPSGPCVLDLGGDNNEDEIQLYVKPVDAEALSNLESIEIRIWLSTGPSDFGDNSTTGYSYVATVTDLGTLSAGSWVQIGVPKSDFVLENGSGVLRDDLDWSTCSGISLTITSKTTTTGANTCSVSFDTIVFSPVENLSGTNIMWVFTYFNTKTGAESDYSEIFAYGGTLSEQQVRLTFPVCPLVNPPDADPDKIHIYRQGGTLVQFQLVGSIDYVPGLEVSWVDNVADAAAGDVLDENNQLPPDHPRGVVGYDGRNWVWGGDDPISGIAIPKNRLYYSKRNQLESFPTDNYVDVGSGEEIVRAFEDDGQLFIFTTVRVHKIIGISDGYEAVHAGVNQGLMSIFGVCKGLRGTYMRCYDGIYEFPTGRKISEQINNVFIGGETVNENPPVTAGQEWQEALEFRDSKLYFSYPSNVAGSGPSAMNDRTLVFNTLYERWHTELWGAFNLFTEPETNILIAGTLMRYGSITDGECGDPGYGGPWPIEMEKGYVDNCYDPVTAGDETLGIPYLVDTKEYDLGLPDQDKQFIDFVADYEARGASITVEIARDQVDSIAGVHESLGTLTGTTRLQKVLPVPTATGNSVAARRLSVRFYGTTLANATAQLAIYKFIHRVILEEIRHNVFLTAWSDCGIPTPKFLRELWIEMDTFDKELDSIEIQADQAVAQIIAGSTDITAPFLSANGRQKFFLALQPDLRGTLVRIKVIPTGTNEVKVWGYGFQALPEPPVVVTLQSPYSDEAWPYNKLWKEVALDIDTIEKPITVYFWLDGEVRDKWEVTTETRRELTHSLPVDLIGKLGRITVNENFLDECLNPNGFRYYKHSYVIDKQPPDVTIADSYVQTLNFDRKKILKRLWLTMRNPDQEVTLEIYIDGRLRETQVIAADPQPSGFSKRRITLGPNLKGYVFRFVFTSPLAFEIHGDKSELELKGLNPEDTWGRYQFAHPQTF